MNFKKHIVRMSMLAIASICVFASCTDMFYDEEAPTVKIKSIESIYDTVVITWQITNNGSSKIKSTGFRYKDDSNSTTSFIQVQTPSPNGQIFTERICLDSEITYYFKVYAENREIVGESDVVEFKTPASTRPVPAVPVTLTDDYVTFNGTPYEISWTYCGYGEIEYPYYGFETACYFSNGPAVNINFKHRPTNGIYTTCGSYGLYQTPKSVHISLQKGSNYYLINAGSPVYVESTPTNITISCCNLTYTSNNVSYPFSAKIVGY